MANPVIRRHADQLAHVADLSLAHFGNGIAEVVVGGDTEDFDAFALGDAQQFLAFVLRPVERIAMRPLAVDLNAIVTEFFRRMDELWQGERLAAIPAAEIGDAIESNFHKVSFGSLEFSGGPENGIMNERTIRGMPERSVIVTELDEHHFGSPARADPSDGAVAGEIVRQEQRLNVRGNEEPLVGFIGDAERGDA